jgi:nucleoside-diphosphate-sugar epimerase
LRILITGAGGFIGQRLTAAMAAIGHHVVAIIRNSTPSLAATTTDRIQWLRAELANGLDEVPPVDAIIHAAAQTHLILDSTANDYIRSNVIGAQRLADYAERSNARAVVHLSTVSIYGDVPPGVLTEKTPLTTPSLYGATKYLAELILAESHRTFASVSVRLPGVVAPGYFTPWIGQIVRKALDGSPITIYNPTALFNNIIDIDELARFISHVLPTLKAPAETINLAASEPLPIRHAVETVLKVTGSRAPVTEGPARKGSFVIDTDRVQQLFGFEPLPTQAMITRFAQGCLRYKEREIQVR